MSAHPGAFGGACMSDWARIRFLLVNRRTAASAVLIDAIHRQAATGGDWQKQACVMRTKSPGSHRQRAFASGMAAS